jgi:hypothetical protein
MTFPLFPFRRRLALMVMAAIAFPASLLAAGTTQAIPADPSDGEQALQTLLELLSAYAEGRQQVFEGFLLPQMVGHARLVDSVRGSLQAEGQRRVTLSDTRTVVSGDVAIIRTRWEKRLLQKPALLPQLKSGSVTFVMQRDPAGWKLAVTGGNSPFEPN